MDTKPTVLIVEDEQINRIILKKILALDYHVLEAENGQIGWEIIQAQGKQISAVLLDIVMPVMNGYQLLQKIQNAGMNDLPVIVLTGEANAQEEQKALDAGAWDFVTKPYGPKVLRSRLKNAIARSQIAMYEQIQHMSEHDALTGLHNRGKMYADTEELLKGHADQQFVFLRADIEHFALFNSSFGEAEGDKLLCYFSKMIRDFSREHMPCTYGRMNADIFCMCLPYDGDVQMVCSRVEEMNRKLANYREDYVLRMVVGAYVVEDPYISIEECYIRASMGAQKCKKQYGDSIEFYDDSFGQKVAEEIEIVGEMQTALEEDQFIVYLQPKFDLSTDRICGAEALVRWLHPEKGLVSPGAFIPVFEKNGFIAKVDYRVWEKTCQMLKKWIDQGIRPHPISVNISRISLYNPNLAEMLRNLVEKYEISPSLLQLEITESAYMTNAELMEKTIHELRESGFTILMDDFGSEYSSLNTLKSIEVDVLKVDMKFLPKGEEMEKGEIILASVIQMAKWLGMTTIVEGVETRRQRDFLDGVGCECIQGYYYSRPIPQEEYEYKYVYEKPEDKKELPSDGEETPKYNVTILIIDDDDMDRAIIREYFHEQYHVHEAGSAEEGLAYLKKNRNKIRLILVDNIMKGMSGMDFLRICQEDKTVQSIPVIMITANENIQDQVAAFQMGAYDYITKPLVKEVVLARVGHVMEVNSQLRSFESAESNYRHQVELDTATGLLNKTAFREISSKALMISTEDTKALMVLDIDDFKNVNDQYGHLVGDKIIKTVADNLASVYRKSDIIGRFGGDEFVAFLTGLPNEEFARRKAEEVLKGIIFAGLEKYHINLSLSVGIAFYEHGDTMDTIFARADQALYDAKSSGKSKVVVYGEMVPPIQNDDKPVIMICGEDAQLYPSIALSYGDSAAFSHITSFEDLKASFHKYGSRVRAVCLDMQKRVVEDSDEFYRFIIEQGGGDTIPIIAICKEGNIPMIREAMELNIQDVLTLPPQSDVIRRCLARCIAAGQVK